MQFIIATTKSGVYRLQVFNRGFHIATHNSESRKYVNRRIKGYIARQQANPNHAGHGYPTNVIWA